MSLMDQNKKLGQIEPLKATSSSDLQPNSRAPGGSNAGSPLGMANPGGQKQGGPGRFQWGNPNGGGWGGPQSNNSQSNSWGGGWGGPSPMGGGFANAMGGPSQGLGGGGPNPWGGGQFMGGAMPQLPLGLGGGGPAPLGGGFSNERVPAELAALQAAGARSNQLTPASGGRGNQLTPAGGGRGNQLTPAGGGGPESQGFWNWLGGGEGNKNPWAHFPPWMKNLMKETSQSMLGQLRKPTPWFDTKRRFAQTDDMRKEAWNLQKRDTRQGMKASDKALDYANRAANQYGNREIKKLDARDYRYDPSKVQGDASVDGDFNVNPADQLNAAVMKGQFGYDAAQQGGIERIDDPRKMTYRGVDLKKNAVDPNLIEGDYSIAGGGRVIDNAPGEANTVQKYMNPYQEQVQDEVIKRIEESADKARNRIGADAMRSGAFGDARHGIENAELQESTLDAIARAEADARTAAFDRAMSLRGTDIDRNMQEQMYNAQAGRDQDVYNAQARDRSDFWSADTGVQQAMMNAQLAREKERFNIGNTMTTNAANAAAENARRAQNTQLSQQARGDTTQMGYNQAAQNTQLEQQARMANQANRQAARMQDAQLGLNQSGQNAQLLQQRMMQDAAYRQQARDAYAGREMQADIYNRGLDKDALNRLLQSGQVRMGNVAQNQNIDNTYIQQMLRSGSQRQQEAQNKRDFDYERFLWRQQQPLNVAAAATGVYSGVPFQPQQQQGGGSSWLGGLLGGIGGLFS